MKILAQNSTYRMLYESRGGLLAMERWWLQQWSGTEWDSQVFFNEIDALSAAKSAGLDIDQDDERATP